MPDHNLNWLWSFVRSKQGNIQLIDKVLSGVAGLIAIGLTMWVSQIWLSGASLPIIVASTGATVVLVFAVPQGQLSQPWPVLGGHVISALIGVTCAQQIPDVILAASLAVGLSITMMYISGCLHPPGGATALLCVIGGPSVLELGYLFVLYPVLLNVLVVLSVAFLLNNLLPRRHYPNALTDYKETRKDESVTKQPNIRHQLREALLEMNTFIDASEEDLAQVFNAMMTNERRARIGEVTCQDVMTKRFVSVDYDTEVETVWMYMVEKHLRMVTVLDSRQVVIGIISMSDFFRQVASGGGSIMDRLKAYVKRTEGLTSDKIEFAGHLMNRQVSTVRYDQHIVDLFPLFEQHGVIHVPVVDSNGKMIGLVTIKKLLAALHSDFLQYHEQFQQQS